MKKLTTTFAALVAAAGLFTQTANAEHRYTIDELAHQLKRDTALAAREVRFGFRHSRHYRHLYRDIHDMYHLADHIHDVGHDRARLAHIRKDVEELDELFHHAEEMIDDMRGHGHHGHGDHFGSGRFGHRVSRLHLRKLSRTMSDIGHTLHELYDLVGYTKGTPRVRKPETVRELPPVPRRRGGIRLRSRRGGVAFSLTIP